MSKSLQNVHAFGPAIILIRIYRTSELAMKMFVTVLFIIVKVRNNLMFNSKGLVK